jgi:hypothetical protein
MEFFCIGKTAWEVISSSPDFLTTAPTTAANVVANSSETGRKTAPVRRPRIDLVLEPTVKVTETLFFFLE